MLKAGRARAWTGSAKGIVQLNKQIYDISQKKEKLVRESQILGELMREYFGLAFDKLALENAGKCNDPNVELELQIARVIMGHLRAAAHYFEVNEVPLSSSKKSKAWHLNLRKVLWMDIYFSKRAAESRLHELAGEYLVLRARHIEIKATIKRFEEDNQALRQEVTMIQRSSKTQREYQGIDDTWNRMANVDLLKSHHHQAQELNRRRSSASVRSVSSPAFRPRSFIGRPSSAAESWMGGIVCANSGAADISRITSTRRRSGASCLNSWGSESEGSSLKTTESSLDSRTNTIRPKRYSSYDPWGKKIPISVI